MKKYLLPLLLGLTIVIIAAIVYLNQQIDIRQEQDLKNEERAERLRQSLRQLTDEVRYQRYCGDDVQSLESANDVIKAISMLPGGADRYYQGEKEIVCPKNIPAEDRSNDCRSVQDFNYRPVYACPEAVPLSLTDGRNGFKMRQQEPGNAVIVDLVIMEQPGFIVVHTLNAQGQPGDIIGHSPWLNYGAWDIVSMAVTETLANKKNYLAVLYQDDGDKEFSAENDLPLKITDDQLLSVKFGVSR